jgi:hypothetical protein
MSGYELEGNLRRKLRDAIARGFDRTLLDQTLRDYNLYDPDVSDGPALSTRIDSLIDVFERKGRLIELCVALAKDREHNALVYSDIVRAQQWLVERKFKKVRAVVSALGTEAKWKENFKKVFSRALLLEQTGYYCEYIDTLERVLQSAENVPGLLRDIDDTSLFIAIVSKRYAMHPPAVTELERALSHLMPGPNGQPPCRRVLTFALDEEGRDWIAGKIQNLDPACAVCVFVEEFFSDKTKRPVEDDAGEAQIRDVVNRLQGYFIGQELKVAAPPPVAPEPNPIVVPAPSELVVILGESNGQSEPVAVRAADDLASELKARNVPYERWDDGWGEPKKSLDAVAKRPVLVRMVSDPSKVDVNDAAKDFSYELNDAFGFRFNDRSEKVRPLMDCPKVLWRPRGAAWSPAGEGPLIYSSTDEPAELGRWLEKLLGRHLGSSAIVHYEDPAAKGDAENSIRRQVVEGCLLEAVTTEEPPLQPDSAPFGYDQLIDVINSVGKDTITVIAAHDLRTPPGSREATIERFREIDRRIDQTLASKRAENAPLMRIAVLLRNASLFPALEFSRNSRIRDWQLLRIFKDSNGTYRPDTANLERLREYAADLARRAPELRAS